MTLELAGSLNRNARTLAALGRGFDLPTCSNKGFPGHLEVLFLFFVSLSFFIRSLLSSFSLHLLSSSHIFSAFFGLSGKPCQYALLLSLGQGLQPEALSQAMICWFWASCPRLWSGSKAFSSRFCHQVWHHVRDLFGSCEISVDVSLLKTSPLVEISETNLNVSLRFSGVHKAKSFPMIKARHNISQIYRWNMFLTTEIFTVFYSSWSKSCDIRKQFVPANREPWHAADPS